MGAEWFAGRLRELRTNAGLTQKELAERAGLGLRMITYVESGEQTPSWATVVALSQALAVPTDAFLQPPGELPPPRPGRPRKEKAKADGGGTKNSTPRRKR
jgi:transcriptional regulator with XRE-family HTH domain